MTAIGRGRLRLAARVRGLGWRTTAKVLLVALIVAYGAILRLAAITEIYGPVAQPGWLRAVQHVVVASPYLRPSALRWESTELFPHKDGPPTQYRSDPYTYLEYAREMRSFYAGHRREPLFPFATKASLALLSDQDVAVSFASATFSVLAIAAAFLLGATAFSFGVGAGAAALMAIEYELITWGVGGWRDDAFMLAVLLTAVALLRFWRSPDWRTALVLGIIAGGACLVRITSLSFILPGLLAVVLLPRAGMGARVKGGLIALAVAACIVGPFLVNCWRKYGDPLYSINVHASDYREIEGRGADPSLSAGNYLRGHLRGQPMRTIDTIVQGMTVYPFSNKWHGFHQWLPAAGPWLSRIAMAGLLLFAAFPAGRVLLVIIVFSLLPYAATWKLAADFRFTQHAYPLFLIAVCLTIVLLLTGLARLRRPGDVARAARSRIVPLAAAAAVAGAVWYLATRILPVQVVNETLRADEPAMIMALDRDGAFFSRNWKPGPSGLLPTRVFDGRRAVIDVPLPGPGPYDILLRVDPAPGPVEEHAPVERIHLLLNGRLLGRCDPGSTPDRIGVCRVRVSPDAADPGMHRLGLAGDSERIRGFRVWYIRLEPVVE